MTPDEYEKHKLINQDIAFQIALAKAIKQGLERMPISLFEKRSKCEQDRLTKHRNGARKWVK
jgi:hypothetical protein